MKHIALSIVTLVVFLSQFAAPIRVQADGETPVTPTDIPVESAKDSGTALPPLPDTKAPIPTDPQPSTPPAATSTPVPSSVLDLEDTSAGSLTPEISETTEMVTRKDSASEPSSSALSETEQSTLLESAKTISNGTNVVVLGDSGELLSLASQEAAQVISQSDPVWCPAGQSPTPGMNGCTPGYATLGDLVNSEGNNIAANGTIWITSGSMSDTNIVIMEGSTYTTWSNYTLTLQGGWSGVSGDTGIMSNSIFSTSLILSGWNNDVAVNNITITDAANGANTGLAVITNTGDISVDHISISSNVIDYGAFLVAHQGDITVDHSNFDDNGFSVGRELHGVGAFVLTENGNITINNSSFNGNGFNGLNVGMNSDSNLSINNSSFNDNGFMGASLIADTGEHIINNSVFSGNRFGAGVGDNTFTFNNSVFAHNEAAISLHSAIVNGVCETEHTVVLNNATLIGNTMIVSNPYDCVLHLFVSTATPTDTPATPTVTPTAPSSTSVPVDRKEHGKIETLCTDNASYLIHLSNGDWVQVFCPVDGTVSASHMTQDSLPAALPVEDIYVSAIAVEIVQNDQPVSVITEGGHLTLSYQIPAFQERHSYSLLYWENGSWISVQEFTVNQAGDLQVLRQTPGTPEDSRKVINSLRLITIDGAPHIEVSTNFPGIFALAQQ